MLGLKTFQSTHCTVRSVIICVGAQVFRQGHCERDCVLVDESLVALLLAIGARCAAVRGANTGETDFVLFVRNSSG